MSNPNYSERFTCNDCEEQFSHVGDGPAQCPYCTSADVESIEDNGGDDDEPVRGRDIDD